MSTIRTHFPVFTSLVTGNDPQKDAHGFEKSASFVTHVNQYVLKKHEKRLLKKKEESNFRQKFLFQLFPFFDIGLDCFHKK